MYRKSFFLALCAMRQQGFMLPLTLFILLAIAGMAIAIQRLMFQNNHATFFDGVSAQALYAAETGAQFAMHHVLFNVSDASVANTRCMNVSSTPPSLTSAQGLQTCSATLSCTSATLGTQTLFYIQSVGRCGEGEYTAERTIAVTAAL